MTVYFIGAGPGAADLITLRGLKILQNCQSCLYAGSLVAEEMLAHLPAGAERRSSYGMALEEIIRFLQRAEAAGQNVARLHSGDVSFLSAAGEQIRALKALGIAYEIIPGVPAYAAAAAAIGQELTVPGLCQSLILTRAAANATPMPPKETLVNLAAAQAVMALHLFASRAAELAAELLPFYGADCPIIIAARISRPDQKIIRGNLAELAELTVKAGIRRAALLLIGRALAAGEALAPAADSRNRSHLYSRRNN